MSYKFKTPVSKDNFIYKYIEYGSECCDASHAYHEAHALGLLSAACFGLKLMLPIHPSGLRPNLYFMIVGESSFTRKTTAMKIAMDLQKTAIPIARLPGDFTPGGLESALEEMSPGPAIMYLDEFKGMFVKMHKLQYMSGTREMFLRLYDDDYMVYRRANKKGKVDMVEIKDVSLSVIGNITPSFIDELNLMDVEDGFLARFAMVYPEDKPKRIPLDQIKPLDILKKNKLVMYLSKLLDRIINLDGIDATIDMDAMKAIDKFIQGIEAKARDPVEITLIERLSTMVVKVSMLVAVGEVDPDTFTSINIKKEYIDQSIKIIESWRNGAMRFIDKIGTSDFERTCRKIEARVDREGAIKRSDLMRAYKLSSRLMNDITLTLTQRESVSLTEENINGSRKPTLMFVSNKKEKENEDVPVPVSSDAGETQGAKVAQD